MIELENVFIEEILLQYKSVLGIDYDKYRHHVYRVFNLALSLHSFEGDEKIKLAVASAFHDIGIWTDQTFDYLNPSIVRAKKYLQEKQLSYLGDDVALMIENHHKLFAYRSANAVEVFRQADLIDLSFGLFSFGLNRKAIFSINTAFPALGFHRFIAKQILLNTIKHPFNPLPILKI